MMALSARLVFRSARQVLPQRMSPDATRRVLAEAERDLRRRALDLPHEATFGGRVMLQMAAACVALHGALRDAGADEGEACGRVGATMNRLWDAALTPAAALSRRTLSDRKRRLSMAMDLSRKYLFAPPAWRMETVEGGDGQENFDVHRCPLADYLVPQGLSLLCKAAFCDGDELLAERLDLQLERTGLLSTGADICDFRWTS